MTNEEIFKKVIEKAVKNGMKKYEGCTEEQWENLLESIDRNLSYLFNYGGYFAMIFSHSFAKAFWGDGKVKRKRQSIVICNTCLSSQNTTTLSAIPAWRHHFQAMVLEEKPLKYIEKFL